jgi:UMF1 family MFS transporter
MGKSGSRALAADVSLREVWAWSMYDFANSGYTTVVITAVFNAYFVAAVAGKAPWATFAWTAALSVSYLAVLLTAPMIGAWADAHAAKKKLLLAATVGCVLFTAGLCFATPGAVALAVVLVVLSNFFFATGENLIAAFLPELAESQAMGRVSGWGWAFGYLGGLLSLGISLAYITWAQKQGQSGGDFVPVVMLITAAVFALCATPTFLFLRERAVPQPQMENPWARVLHTLRHAREYADLRRFLVCILFYQAGIMAVIALAAIYAQEAMKFTTQQTIVLILVVNITAAIGAFGFGYLQDRIGHIRRDAARPRRLDRDDRARLCRRERRDVLGGREPRGTLHGLFAGRRTGDRRIPVAAAAAGRILRPVGPRGEGRRRSSAPHLRRRDLDIRGQPPARHSCGGHLLCHRLALLAGIDVERGRRAALQAT